MILSEYKKIRLVAACIPFAVCAIINIILGTVSYAAGEIADFLHEWTMRKDV